MRGVVRQIRAAMRVRPPVTVPLAFEPGEEAQADFGEAWVVMKGERVKVHMLIVTLCYSRRCFVMGFPSPNQEAFLQAQVEAFRHLGGVPGRIAYDNPKVAVTKILPRNEREENETFKAFRSHYCFEPRYCTPGKEGAHEKGTCGATRRLVPQQRTCSPPGGWGTGRNSTGTFESVRRPRMRTPIPSSRTGRWARCTRKSASGSVLFLGLTSSVPSIVAPGSTDRVGCSSRRSATRSRASMGAARWNCGPSGTGWRSTTARTSLWSGRAATSPRRVPRLPPLPEGAPVHAGGVAQREAVSELPEVLLRYREELLQRRERRQAGRELARVLSLLLEQPEKTVLEAVELALLCGTVDADAVSGLVRQLRHGPSQPAGLLDLAGRPSLAVVEGGAGQSDPVQPTDRRADPVSSKLLIEAHLKRLKLPAIKRNYEAMAREAATANQTYEAYLLALLEQEVQQRDESLQRSRIQGARFPSVKTLDQFDFSVVPDLNKARVAPPRAGRICREARERRPRRHQWNGQDPCGHQPRGLCLPPGPPRPLRDGSGACQRTDGGPPGTPPQPPRGLLPACRGFLSWTNSGSCRSPRTAPNCSSTCSPPGTSDEPPW